MAAAGDTGTRCVCVRVVWSVECGRLLDKIDEAGLSLSKRSLVSSPDGVRRWRDDEPGTEFCGRDERFALCRARPRALTFFLPAYSS